MKKFFKIGLLKFVLIISALQVAGAASLEDILKSDFTGQETIKVKFEVNKRLYSFEAGKFKLQKISKNRDKINDITKKIIPWALMEGLKPVDIARIIVYMYYADDAGASFLDAEDLIPMVSQKDIPLEDFVLYVQYIRETKKAGIPQEYREALIGFAFYEGWDGLSVLAAGRGLLLARRYGFNLNKAASALLKNIPKKSKNVSSQTLVNIITKIINKNTDVKLTSKLIENFKEIHNIVKNEEPSPEELRKIYAIGLKVDFLTKKISEYKTPDKPKRNDIIDREDNIVPDRDDRDTRPPVSNWQVLSKDKLKDAIAKWLGTPYLFGSKGPRTIDCSGFTRAVMLDKRVGVPNSKIGVGTINQRNDGVAANTSALKTGDLLFFSASPNRKKITHVALIYDSEKMAHASSSKGVIYVSYKKRYWQSRVVKARRLFKRVTD